VVVTNAGVCTVQRWDEVDPVVWDTVVGVNLTGTWNTCVAAIPHLRERGGGSMVLISSTAGLKGSTFSTIFGLLAVTGLRVSEALALDREDVDLEEGVLRIRRTKFGKSRLVAVHESTRQKLADYTCKRDRVVHRPVTAAFFLSERGGRVTEWAARYNFAKVSREVGLRAPTTCCRHGRGPRLHDMRHRFAVCTLLEWYRAGIDVEREIPKLATYLGHVHVNETYWYIEAVPELLELATRRLESPKEMKP